jgi:putative ABC transport system permease protein
LALFVLAMAYINYINLSSIKAIDRAKEIGVRKVIGSNRRQLITQFLLESFIVNVMAAFVAGAIVFWLENEYQSLVGEKISTALLKKKDIWIALTSLLVVGSIASGLYPAFLISSFKPVKVLKGKFAILGKSTSFNPRRVMVTFQFVLAMILITGCAVIYKQIKFLQDKDIGMDIEQTLVLRTFAKFGPPGTDSIFINKLDALKNALLKNKSIKGATASYDIPGKEHLSLFSNFRSITNTEELISLYYSRIDYEFIPLFKVGLVAGRNFSKDILTDQHAIIINLEALKTFGFVKPDEAIDHDVTLGRDPDHLRKIKIIGVVDFRSTSFKEKNYPVVYQINWAPLRFLSVKFEHLKDKSTVSQNLHFIKQEWEKLFPEKPFDYFFLDEFFNKQYEADKNFSQTLTLFTCLAIFIACLGLYGLSSFVTTHRAKEIGIRKILGASIRTLFLMLIRDFGMLILVAGGISFPIIWYTLTKWLQTYAYSTELSWWVFLMPIISMLIIVFITVGQQALKTTLANPVEVLKDE